MTVSRGDGRDCLSLRFDGTKSQRHAQRDNERTRSDNLEKCPLAHAHNTASPEHATERDWKFHALA